MELNEIARQKLIAKFRTFVSTTGVSIFTPKTRKRLLGLEGLTGRGRTKSDFWYDQRNRVGHGLKDLEIFIKVAGESNVNQVLTSENLKPVVEALLWHPVVEKAKPDMSRAEIAQLFIQQGFAYLQAKKRDHITLSHERSIREALDLCSYLVETFKPEAERRTRPSQPR